MQTRSRFRLTVKRARACTLLLLASDVLVPVAGAQPKTSESNRFELHFSLSSDFGGSGAYVPQPLPADWQSLFQPPNGRMATKRSDRAWSIELGAGLEPALVIGRQWKLGMPVSYSFVGWATPAGANARAYVATKPVAGTKLQWWDPVFLHATAVQRTSPAIGLSVQRGRLLVQASVQPYRIIGEDFGGKDCEGCVNTSYLVGTQEYSRGTGHRVEVLFQPDDGHGAGTGTGIGIFFERDGSQVWQAGARLRLTFTVAGRKDAQSN